MPRFAQLRSIAAPVRCISRFWPGKPTHYLTPPPTRFIVQRAEPPGLVGGRYVPPAVLEGPVSCCSIRTCLTRLVAVAICAISSSASAALVTYSTAGSFDGGPFVSDSAITLGGVTLNYSGLIPTTVDANPSSFISLGTFTATGLGTADLTGRDFDLRITQTAPGAGTQTIDADLSGTITGSVGSG